MKNLMSRFGGHAVIFGAGKASKKLLPTDQSLDNLLDNYAQEIIPHNFFISSYDAIPEYMGMYEWSDKYQERNNCVPTEHKSYGGLVYGQFCQNK